MAAAQVASVGGSEPLTMLDLIRSSKYSQLASSIESIGLQGQVNEVTSFGGTLIVDSELLEATQGAAFAFLDFDGSASGGVSSAASAEQIILRHFFNRGVVEPSDLNIPAMVDTYRKVLYASFDGVLTVSATSDGKAKVKMTTDKPIAVGTNASGKKLAIWEAAKPIPVAKDDFKIANFKSSSTGQVRRRRGRKPKTKTAFGYDAGYNGGAEGGDPFDRVGWFENLIKDYGASVQPGTSFENPFVNATVAILDVLKAEYKELYDGIIPTLSPVPMLDFLMYTEPFMTEGNPILSDEIMEKAKAATKRDGITKFVSYLNEAKAAIPDQAGVVAEIEKLRLRIVAMPSPGDKLKAIAAAYEDLYTNNKIGDKSGIFPEKAFNFLRGKIKWKQVFDEWKIFFFKTVLDTEILGDVRAGLFEFYTKLAPGTFKGMTWFVPDNEKRIPKATIDLYVNSTAFLGVPITQAVRGAGPYAYAVGGVDLDKALELMSVDKNPVNRYDFDLAAEIYLIAYGAR